MNDRFANLWLHNGLIAFTVGVGILTLIFYIIMVLPSGMSMQSGSGSVHGMTQSK